MNRRVISGMVICLAINVGMASLSHGECLAASSTCYGMQDPSYGLDYTLPMRERCPVRAVNGEPVQLIPKIMKRNVPLNGCSLSSNRCQVGYRICSIPDCVSEPCQNGGRCEETQESYICHCTPVFTGSYCEIARTTESTRITTTPRSDVAPLQTTQSPPPTTRSPTTQPSPDQGQAARTTDCDDQAMSAADTRTAIVCEDRKCSIRCSGSGVIHIASANYGRKAPGNVVCPHVHVSDTNCSHPNSETVVRGLCENKTSCELMASNAAFGSHPCGGTYKYLEVSFSCQ